MQEAKTIRLVVANITAPSSIIRIQQRTTFVNLWNTLEVVTNKNPQVLAFFVSSAFVFLSLASLLFVALPGELQPPETIVSLSSLSHQLLGRNAAQRVGNSVQQPSGTAAHSDGGGGRGEKVRGMILEREGMKVMEQDLEIRYIEEF